MSQAPDYRQDAATALEAWQKAPGTAPGPGTVPAPGEPQVPKQIAQDLLLVPEVDFADPVGVAAQEVLIAVDEDLPAAVAKLLEALKTAQAAESQAPCVLAVDDDPMALAMIEFCLSGKGMTIHTAANGAEAKAMFDRITFDLILLDYQLPDSDGKTLLALLRTKARSANTPVLILTAETEVGVTREFLRLGAQAVVSKPFTPIKLNEAVAAVLPRRA